MTRLLMPFLVSPVIGHKACTHVEKCGSQRALTNKAA